MMPLFSQEAGQPAAVLLDEGHLTVVRTAAAGAIGTKKPRPRTVERIAILGTGVQVRLQLEYLMPVVDGRNVPDRGRMPDRPTARQTADGDGGTPERNRPPGKPRTWLKFACKPKTEFDP